MLEEPLQQIDQDYYRTVQLLIARAEIAQLRRQASAVARTERLRNIPAETHSPGAN